MTTDDLVVTLHPDAELAAEAVRDALLIGPFTLGEQLGRRLAMVLQAETPAEAESWRDWLARLPGVVRVDIVCAQVGEATGPVGCSAGTFLGQK